MLLAAALALPAGLAGCGTIERGRSDFVAVVVHPALATVTTSRGDRCEGSCILDVPRREGFTVTAAAPGYLSKTVEVKSVATLEGMRSTATNAAGPGVVGVGVDLYTGAVYDHRPNPVSIRLDPDPSARPGGSAAPNALPPAPSRGPIGPPAPVS
ncbi:translation initiation factor 2 [Antarcticirhabdus aurantiaca]|uniref:Translation initiation factor 2 n=1 Tax=Antarcticirhabdus aurantiaca TaxID=2606717 RepID=A0ACD4NSG8_9HYPH|nr:translation initiation factor 2 [Antarcticirhabdus aurantiaca]WAJ29683.1 translation initiation factor 2 [Jeongeuplla avenae]